MSRLATGEFYGEIRERFAAVDAVLTRLSHAQARRLPLHIHGAPYYSLLIRGGYRESWRGGQIDYRPLTLVFHPPETCHIDEISDAGGLFFTIELEQSWIERVAASSMPRIGEQEPDLVWLVLQLYLRQRRSELAPLDVEPVLLELLARTMRVHTIEEKAMPRWLERVMELLRARFEDPPSVGELAAEAGVHPVHLSRVFRQRFGVTIGDYVHRLRVEFAARSLASGQFPTLADLAPQMGFADQSHFSRVFKRLTGTSPGKLSRLLAEN